MAAAETFACIHGVDLLKWCARCSALVDRMTKEYDMQTSGTFPQLNRKDSVTRPSKKGSSKKGGGKGC